jgi:hypothetical protein
LSVAGALVVAALLAGCGTTTYFAGRKLPPSGIANRVVISLQNPSALSSGSLQIVDAFYDIRYKYNSTNTASAYSISGYSGKLPTTIQNMPEEQAGGVYGSADGSFQLVNYAKESSGTKISNLSGTSSSIFVTRNESYVFAANQTSHLLTVVDETNGGTYTFSLPGVYRVSVNPGGSMALAFVQNSNYAYYLRKLSASETVASSGGQSTWPLGAQDCEPQTGPGWCLFQALDSTSTSMSIKPLVFDRPVKAVFSADGGTAYVLNCGAECGGNTASISQLPVAPMIFLIDQASGSLPTQSVLNTNTIAIPGGASNALIDGTTMYVVGQEWNGSYWGGNLTVVNLSNNTISFPAVSISDGEPGAISRMIEADDDTLWIGMSKCTSGVRYNTGLPYGCLTMYNTTTKSVTLLEPYNGDATGIAAITGLNKIYTAEGGQVYIYSTIDGSAINNANVMVSATAYDVAYMDALSDSNNTDY